MATRKHLGFQTAMIAGAILFTSAGFANATTWFVSAAVQPGGSGSEKLPFNSLAEVEKASAPGDEIVILPSPMSVPALDGGIALKSHQKLSGRGAPVSDPSAPPTLAARITNTSAARIAGDAVVLADHAEVSNLVIEGAYRGGVYGLNVRDVDIHDNNIAATNTSCTTGFVVMFPSNVALLPNGWAAILVDQDQGYAEVAVHNNYIHDGACNDGIDIRASGSASVLARVSSNTITRLAQGPKKRSLLAIGLQTRDRGILTVDSDHNVQTYIGSPGADCEGLFANQTGGALTWSIEHNTFAHGIGGVSCNGGEFFLSMGPATMNIYLAHSDFEDDPGDMIEEVNESKDAAVNLVLMDVTIKHTTGSFPPEPKFSDTDHTGDVNLGRCVDQGSHGHHNVNNLHVFNSHFSDCSGDGIGSVVAANLPFAAPAGTHAASTLPPMDFGDGEGDSMSIEIENSIIEGTPQYALHFENEAHMNELAVRVRNSVFAGARGGATVAFDQSGSSRREIIDLDGDGKAGNCILPGAGPALEATGLKVTSKHSWWGHATGPRAAEVSTTNGEADASSPARAATPTCRKSD